MKNQIADIVVKAVDLSGTLRAAHHRSFERAVREFTGLLQTVPDYAPRQVDDESLSLLARTADEVIERIEERVSRGRDSPAVSLHLVETVYDIRAALEEIDRWRRHYRVQADTASI